MKTGKCHCLLTLTFAATLLFASSTHAYYTNYLDIASNALTSAYISLTSSPAPTKLEKKQAAILLRALKDLSKPSTSVAGDYVLFFTAASHLGQLALSPQLAPVGSSVFNLFTNEAQAQIDLTAARTAALNDFVRVKRSASNSVAQAQANQNKIESTADIRLSLILARLVFTKLGVANKLAANGEAHPGFARENVVGLTLEHHEGGHSGTVDFDDATQATETEPNDMGGTDIHIDSYTWTRTGLNTATLVLTHDDGNGGTNTTTVKIRFTSSTTGTFTFRNVDVDHTESGSGSFTLSRKKGA